MFFHFFHSVTRLIVASNTSSAAAATFFSACRAVSGSSSSTQQQIEAYAKETIQRLTIFVSTVMNFPAPSDQSVTQTEKHLRMLQLEQTLEKDRSNVRDPHCLVSLSSLAHASSVSLSLSFAHAGTRVQASKEFQPLWK